ncbi:hypothetical protein LT493_08645 [Streptomyces tricolor]|nr:hypothetical protein [Streptomyces tricolor]
MPERLRRPRLQRPVPRAAAARRHRRGQGDVRTPDGPPLTLSHHGEP